jgi:hypothetical protein
MKIKVACLAGKFVLSCLAIACLLLIGLEWQHHHEYGHLFSYGLHVDVLNDDFNIGIPGQTKMYWARLSNYSLLPVRLPACDFVSDTLTPGTEYAYAVQRYDEASKSWQTIADATEDGFCLPAPLSKGDTHVVYRYLLPGSSVKVMDGEATGAREPFRKGELARFVVFRRMAQSGDWPSAIPSEPFRIEDDVIRDNGSFRVKH